MKIEDLNLSVRAINCLENAGVKTIEEMALIDLSTLRNCGSKTQIEIEDKINELKEKGMYSAKFIEEHLSEKKETFVDELPLTNRSKNILHSLSITNAAQLLSLDEETLYRTRNAGKSSIEEILSYIADNKDELIQESMSDENVEYKIPLELYANFSGNTLLKNIPMSSPLFKELECNNIYTILELITNKIIVAKNNENEYLKIYQYFRNMAYGNLKINRSGLTNSYYVKLPFSIKEYQESENIKISTFIQYILDNFNDFTIEEMINVKLYLNWLNIYIKIDMEEYYIKELELTEKQLNIIGKRLYTTLEEIAETYDLTRERIRQIEKKANKKLEKIIGKIPFIALDLTKVYEVSSMSDKEVILMYIDSKYHNNFINIKENGNIYFVPKYHLNKIEKQLEEEKTKLETYGYILYEDEKYPEILKYTLMYMNINIHNGRIFPTMTKRQQIKYAMKHMNRPINLSTDSDLEELGQAAYELFGLEIEGKTRGLEAIISEVGVRVASGTYTVDDSVIPLDFKTLTEIVEYVRKKEIINARDLFVNFGTILNEHNINNEIILYRYLKEELDGQIYFHGVSAVISANNQLTCWGDVVIRDVRKNKKPVNKLDLMVNYSITEAVYQSLPINFDDIIFWSSRELYLKSEISINDNLKNDFISYLNEHQITKFEEIKTYLTSKQENILELNNIVTNINMYHFLTHILNDEFIIDKEKEEVRIKRNKVRIIEETYNEIEELTL